MFQNNKKRVLLFNIIGLSIVISLAFVFIVYILLGDWLKHVWHYPTLFLISLIFSLVLFYIIYRQQEELRAERERLFTLFQHISDGILILDKDKKIVEMNEGAKKWLGSNEISSLFCDICHDSHGKIRICDYEKCFLNHEQLSYYEIRLKNITGKFVPVSISTSTYLGLDKQPLTILSIRNLSEYRKDEQSRIHNLITTSMIKAQEEERKRLSRELHDGIGQSIFSVLLGMEYVFPLLDNEQVKDHLELLRKTTKQTLEEIRHMAVELRPSALDDLGLVAAIKSYIKTYGDTFGIQINFEYLGNKGRLHPNIETALYRISQEALTNAAKYADTERIDVTMEKTKDLFILKITDFGKGFLMDDILKEEKGVGLYGMEERASMLDGNFHITSKLGEGTEIEVRIPLGEDDTYV